MNGELNTLQQNKCPNCGENRDKKCACMRNKCIKCGKSVGNITFTICDVCWEIEHSKAKEEKTMLFPQQLENKSDKELEELKNELNHKIQDLNAEIRELQGERQVIDIVLEERQEEDVIKNFKLSKDHIKLLKEMEFELMQQGDLVFIGVDGKRPFGNSDYYYDAATRILGWKIDKKIDSLTNAQYKKLDKLFKELPLALNLIISKLPMNVKNLYNNLKDQRGKG